MKLVLKNPLVFFDLETTGMNINNDRIVEVSYLKVYPNGNEETKTYRVNPCMPIPKETTAIHNISDEDVKDAPTFGEIAQTLANVFKGADIAGFNLHKFDLPLLAEEFLRADVDFDLKKNKIIDVLVIFHKKEQRTLSAAYKFYCQKELEGAHSAEIDTRATYEVLQAQLDMYSDLENDVNYLADFSAHSRFADFAGRIVYNDKNEEIFNFGKYKGLTVTSVFSKDPSYYAWMMNGDFPRYTKNVITAIKLRAFNNK
jgi:DNA polymerase-3 subunit epsilon